MSSWVPCLGVQIQANRPSQSHARPSAAKAVEDLASRSLSVSELVDFYGQLGSAGQAMPQQGRN